MPALLSAEEVTRQLERFPEWAKDDSDGSVNRKFVFDDFDEAMAFILQIADIARELDHHPELHNVYNEVALGLITHDAGGLTERDFRFVEQVEALFDDEDEDEDD